MGADEKVTPREFVATGLGLVLFSLAALPVSADTVTGTVTIKSTLSKRVTGKRLRPLRRGQTSEGYDSANSGPKDEDEVRSVVVYLVDAPKGASPGSARMSQKNVEFSPYVLPVVMGTTVDFPNQDSVYHSVYSQSPAKPFELPEYKQGESRPVTFDKPGLVEVFCGIHPRMNANILVLPNPFFTQPGADHTFKLENVPPGRYVMKAWHPRLPALSKIIQVKASGTESVEFVL